MERAERRGSIARAIGRLRTALTRRRPKTANIIRREKPEEVTTNMHLHEIERPNEERPTTQLVERATSHPPSISTTPKETCSDKRIEPDGDEYTDNEELLLPIACNRPGISDIKARDLFSRYGLVYQTRDSKSEDEPPRKLRRIEKPICIRIHWTCHACQTQFGLEKTCTNCGHEKCVQCSRCPPKRVQDVKEGGRHMMEQKQSPQQGLVPIEETSKDPSANSTPSSTPVHSAMPSPSPSLQLEPSDDDEDDHGHGHVSIDSSFYTRPSASVRLFKTDHNDPFEEHSRLSKMNRCSFGSRSLQKNSNGEMPMMRGVQRVYRKPRQRVRYTCEHCAALLVEGDRCRECDHNRFVRNSPKRPTMHYDADVLQMVANRLAAEGGGYVPHQGLTA